MNWWIEGVGLAAGTLTTLAYMPQAIKTLKTKHTKDISLGMYMMMTAGIGLWFTYGVLLGSLAIMLANSVSLMLALMILVMKLRHG